MSGLEPGKAEYIRDAQIADGRRRYPVEYTPPPSKQEWWKIYLAIGVLDLNGTDKAVLACLADCANPKTGRCDPSQDWMAETLDIDKRAIERSIAKLLTTPYLRRTRRGQSSNAYNIGWAVLDRCYQAYKERKVNRQKCRIGQGEETRQDCRVDTVKDVGLIPSKVSDENKKGKSKAKIKHEVPSASAAAPDGAASTSGDMPSDHQAGNLACQCQICRRSMAEFTDYRRDREQACEGAMREARKPKPRLVHYPRLYEAFEDEPTMIEVLDRLSRDIQHDASKILALEGREAAAAFVWGRRAA